MLVYSVLWSLKHDQMIQPDVIICLMKHVGQTHKVCSHDVLGF